jgi:hypothetical protein
MTIRGKSHHAPAARPLPRLEFSGFHAGSLNDQVRPIEPKAEIEPYVRYGVSNGVDSGSRKEKKARQNKKVEPGSDLINKVQFRRH